MVDIGNELLEAAGMAEPQVAQEQVQQPVEENVQQPIQQPAERPSGIDPSLFLGALENIHTRMDELKPKPQERPPTEEEMVLQQLAERMGLSSVKQENEQLKSMLEKTQQQTMQMQEYVQKQQIESVQNQILSKYEGITKDMVIGKLHELAGKYGEEFANSLNNSQGWDYVISSHLQQPVSKPDPIVATNSTGDDFLSSATERIKSGKPQDGDIGEILYSYLS